MCGGPDRSFSVEGDGEIGEIQAKRRRGPTLLAFVSSYSVPFLVALSFFGDTFSLLLCPARPPVATNGSLFRHAPRFRPFLYYRGRSRRSPTPSSFFPTPEMRVLTMLRTILWSAWAFSTSTPFINRTDPWIREALVVVAFIWLLYHLFGVTVNTTVNSFVLLFVSCVPMVALSLRPQLASHPISSSSCGTCHAAPHAQLHPSDRFPC